MLSLIAVYPKQICQICLGPCTRNARTTVNLFSFLRQKSKLTGKLASSLLFWRLCYFRGQKSKLLASVIFEANTEIWLNFKAGRYSKGGDVQSVQLLSTHLHCSGVDSTCQFCTPQCAINSIVCSIHCK